MKKSVFEIYLDENEEVRVYISNDLKLKYFIDCIYILILYKLNKWGLYKYKEKK